ncbi:MAG: glycosyltransferase family 2 protein [Candidatus Absconditabacterales bacterium]|nr:glycosyltransferase family 2 protein [Candidatus Absconditabacterales bacterium]
MIYIIIPTYNRAHTLPRAIESCLKQKGDFTIVVVDDGSTDDTRSLIEKYQQSNLGKIIYHYQENGGVCSACNTGINIALQISQDHKCDYVTRLGSDDELHEDAITIYNQYIEKYVNNTIFFFKMINHLGQNHSQIQKDYCITYQQYLSGKYIGGSDANDLIRLDAFLDNDNYFISGLHGGDNIPFHKIIKKTGQCVVSSQITYIAYINTESMTRSVISPKYAKQLLDVQLIILKNFYEDYKKYNPKLIGLHSLIVARNYGMLGDKIQNIKYLFKGIYYSPFDIIRIGLAIIALFPYSLHMINYIIKVFILKNIK